MVGALLKAAPDFERRLAERPTDLPGELCGELVDALHHLLDHPPTDSGSFVDRYLLPVTLRVARSLERSIDCPTGCQLVLGVDRAVDWTDCLLNHLRHASATLA
jgi:hypothetical protein